MIGLTGMGSSLDPGPGLLGPMLPVAGCGARRSAVGAAEIAIEALEARIIICGGHGRTLAVAVMDRLRAREAARMASELKQALRIDLTASGRRLEAGVDGEADLVELRDPSGRLELRLRVTAEGPVLEIDAAALRLCARDISVSCERFTVEAERSVELHSQGEILQRAHGDALLQSQGDLRMHGASTELRATLGEMRLHANDDVRVNGERVRLNC